MVFWLYRWGYITGHGALDAGIPGLPVNTVLPAISGTAAVGSTLTTSNGTWTGVGITYSYQWKRGGVNIGGATGNTYVLVTADIGAAITAAVTATNAAGSVTAITAAVSILAPSRMLSASRAGIGSVVARATASGTYVISNIGAVS